MISHAELIDRLNYDPFTGIFTWKKCRFKNKIGDQAGENIGTAKYIRIKIDKVRYSAHKLAWFYIKKEWPKELIDHIDNDKQNNRFLNLREATHSENSCNRTLAENSSGVRGVFPEGKFWTAQLRKEKKIVFKRRFLLLSDAEKAIKEAREKYHGDFAKHN